MPQSKYGGIPIEDEQPKPGGSKYGGIPVEEAPAEKPATPPQPGVWDSFYNSVQGPRDLIRGINDFASSPVKTLRAMGQQTIDMGRKTVDDFKQGRYISGTARALNTGLNAIVPGLGAQSQEAGEDLARGDYAAGAGKTLGAATNAASTAVLPKIVPPVLNAAAETVTPNFKFMTDRFGRMQGAVGRLTTADPRIAMTRALRPPPSDPGFSAPIPQTLARIKQANGGLVPSGVTNGQLDLIPATRAAIESTQGALEPWMTRAKTAGLRISGEPLIQATREATGKMLPSEASSAENLIGRARTDFARDFTPDELHERLQLLNKRLQSFYSTSPARQSSALADIPEAVLKAQRDAAANSLYRALDPEGEGAGPRLIQSHTGDLINIRDAMLRRNNAIVAEQPVSPLGRLLSPIKRFAQEILPTPPGTGLAFADASEGRTLPLIKRSFKAVDGQPVRALPRPGSPFYPTVSPQRLIPEYTGESGARRLPSADIPPARITDLGAPATREIRTGRLLGPGIQLPPPTELPSGGHEMTVTTGKPLIRGYADLINSGKPRRIKPPQQ